MLAGITISPVNMEDRKGLGIKAGDTVRVHQKIQDKDKTRIQVFEGLVLARKHGNEPGATFTVRKVVDGIGVEKIFPLYSPLIDKIEISRRSKVRRAKLYFIREKVAREIRRQMRRMHLVQLASESEAEMKLREEAKVAEEAKKAEEEASKAEAEKAEAEAQVAEEAKVAESAEEAQVEATLEEESKTEEDSTGEKEETKEVENEEKKN